MSQVSRREFLAGSSALLAPSVVSDLPQSRTAASRDLLGSVCTAERLAASLLSREMWHPFPTAAERDAWTALPPGDRTLLLENGNRALKEPWPALPATLLLEFIRTGNRSNYEAVRDRRRGQLCSLVVAECVEGKGRFIDEIANGIWTTCEESYWGVPAHLGLQKAGPGLPDVAEPTVDLFAAETSSLLAWTLYLIGPGLDRVSPLIRERIHLEVDRRILTPNITRDFYWMGFPDRPGAPVAAPNNWNPWINSNWLTSTLLLERDAKRRVATVHKITRSLDKFLNGYEEDGGCDEGPGYWSRAGGSLFDCLELLYSATGGKLSVYGVPIIQEIGRYIYRAHIHDRYFINFADASAVLNIDGDLVFRYGRRINDEKMSALGAFAAQVKGQSEKSESIGRLLPTLFNASELRRNRAWQPLVRDAWFPGIQVMAARQKDGSAEGFYLAAQGGHNAESHNHNDVGNFIVYADGLPVVVDVGVETYSAKTFSPKRYEIWTMQSAYHNLPTIGGVMQKEGREFKARNVQYQTSDEAAEFSLDIGTAYPREAGLRRWQRTLRLDRAQNLVELTDRYTLDKKAPEIVWTFMTPGTVETVALGEIRFRGISYRSGQVSLLYDARALKCAVEEIPLQDRRLRDSWGERLYRIQLQEPDPPTEGSKLFRIVRR